MCLVNSPHKWPVTRRMFPCYDVIMLRKSINVAIHFTDRYWGGRSSWIPFSQKTRTCWNCIVYTMVADVLTTRGVWVIWRLHVNTAIGYWSVSNNNYSQVISPGHNDAKLTDGIFKTDFVLFSPSIHSISDGYCYIAYRFEAYVKFRCHKTPVAHNVWLSCPIVLQVLNIRALYKTSKRVGDWNGDVIGSKILWDLCLRCQQDK